MHLNDFLTLFNFYEVRTLNCERANKEALEQQTTFNVHNEEIRNMPHNHCSGDI